MTPLDPTVSEFATTDEAEAYDAWFRAKVEAALASSSPGISHDQVVRRVQATIERNRNKRP